jgi:hypothetical protein
MRDPKAGSALGKCRFGRMNEAFLFPDDQFFLAASAQPASPRFL